MLSYSKFCSLFHEIFYLYINTCFFSLYSKIVMVIWNLWLEKKNAMIYIINKQIQMSLSFFSRDWLRAYFVHTECFLHLSFSSYIQCCSLCIHYLLCFIQHIQPEEICFCKQQLIKFFLLLFCTIMVVLKCSFCVCNNFDIQFLHSS